MDAKTCDDELLRKLDAAASPEVSGMLNRYFVAALCESAAARLRFKDAAIDNLAAEVERLQEERRWRAFPANVPDANGRYVCMWADGDVYIQRWEGSKWLGAFDHEITHWQPLPAPPSTTQQTPPEE